MIHLITYKELSAFNMKNSTKNGLKNVFVKISLCLFVLLIPCMLCLYAFQAKRYSELTMEIKELEKKQAMLIDENKKIVNEISVLSSADRIEKMAVEELGMHKAEAEDIVRVEMTGEKK